MRENMVGTCLPADSKATKELVTEGLALGDSRETTVLDLLGVELEGVVGELEALLDERGELTNAATLLTQDFLGVSGADDDLVKTWSQGRDLGYVVGSLLTSVRAWVTRTSQPE